LIVKLAQHGSKEVEAYPADIEHELVAIQASVRLRASVVRLFDADVKICAPGTTADSARSWSLCCADGQTESSTTHKGPAEATSARVQYSGLSSASARCQAGAHTVLADMPGDARRRVGRQGPRGQITTTMPGRDRRRGLGGPSMC
jgi:hypothetical protein